MKKTPSKSVLIGASVMHTAFQYLQSKQGSASIAEIKEKIRPTVANDPWAIEVIESNGLTRWETYLHFFSIDAVKAGFLEKSRGTWTLTVSGHEAAKLEPLDLFNRANSAYKEWRKRQLGIAAKPADATIQDEPIDKIPPEESMTSLQNIADAALAAELFERIMLNTPQFFERLVIALLQKMGYGGFRPDAAKHTGQSGDGGIDGVIHEDELGLDPIYLQAKRYKGSVPDNEVRDFIGALAIRGGKKGVFITTGRFAENALAHARTSQQPKVVLIDGGLLAMLMIKHDVGVSVQKRFELKRIDSDWFDE